MAKLDRLDWAAAHQYDISGFRFVVRSTSLAFLVALGERLTDYRLDLPNAPISPVISVVAPPDGAPPRIRGVRSLFVGYMYGAEVFRCADVHAARRALFGAVDLLGRRQSGLWVQLDAQAVATVGQCVLVYGPRDALPVADLVPETPIRLAQSLALVQHSNSHLVAWPFRATDRPKGLDRRGRPFVATADLIDLDICSPLRVSKVVRLTPGRVSKPQILAELMERCTMSGGSRATVFRTIAALVNSAIVVSGTTN